MLNMHNQLGHRGLAGEDFGLNVVANAFVQLAFYQFPHQRAHRSSLGRTLALFEQTPFPSDYNPEVMTSGWQEALLGCSLADYLGVTLLLAAAASPNNGRFNPAWIEQPNFPQEMRNLFDPAVTRRMLTQFLSAPASSFRKRDLERPGVDRRYTFNPLLDTPVVSGLGADLFMPVPDFVLWKPTPSGLYFTGLRHWDAAFTRDLGHLFEAYVGRQLALVTEAKLYPEIQYGKSNDKSIDWFVVFPDLVLLVEVKVARPKQALRSGTPGAASALQQDLNKANKQLDKTYKLIQSRRSEFDHIPADRPVVGLVVTLEDFHLANSPLHQTWYSRATELPTLVISVDELEGLVGLEGDISDFLSANITASPPYANLRFALSKYYLRDNPLITAGIEASPVVAARKLANNGRWGKVNASRFGDGYTPRLDRNVGSRPGAEV